MKLSEKTKQQIVELKSKGFSSRYIANHLGCSKSTVNDHWNTVKSKFQLQLQQTVKPRVLFLDVETTADLVATFSRKQVNISQSNIVQEGNQLISCALKWLDDDIVDVYASNFDNFQIDEATEKQLLLEIIKQVQQADVVVAHNAGFDMNTIQTRMLHHGLGKLPAVKVVDTLQIARKYLKLRSNKLDSITKYFGLSNKMETEGISLWINVQRGCVKALETMLSYNATDVVILEEVYKKFVPLNAGFNQGLLTDHDGHVCSNCGSHNVKKTGRLVHTSVSSFEEFECTDCGTKLRGRVNILPKEKRKNLLVAL